MDSINFSGKKTQLKPAYKSRATQAMWSGRKGPVGRQQGLKQEQGVKDNAQMTQWSYVQLPKGTVVYIGMDEAW